MAKARASNIVGVIGTSTGTPQDISNAYEIGRFIGENGWILLNGGLGGVMEASARGAFDAGGITVGILPGDDPFEANRYIMIPIVTNMGYARNVIIAHSSDILIAIGGGEGTLSEIAFGLKLKKSIIGIGSWNIPGMIQARDLDEAKALIIEKLKV